jgi:predicted AlkP superfamily pyrophosphatase or phosphodiesterase
MHIARKLTALFPLLALLAAACLCGCATQKPHNIVVMISVDGLAGHYLDDPKAEMPAIRALAAAGARADSMRASNPTVTWPNHTTLVTGVVPARHGVVGNNYFDRATGKTVTLISDPTYDKEQIVLAPTIYDLAHAAGMTTAAIRWPATRNAPTLDWTIPAVSDVNLLHRYTTPALMNETSRAGIWTDGELTEPGKNDKRIIPDKNCTDIFNFVLRKHRPSLALLHVINVDHDQHLYGPNTPQAYAAIKAADEQVRRVWDELQRDFPGHATLIVTSDHGFSRIDKLILPNVILRDAKLLTVKGTRVVGGPLRVVVQGGAAMVYILDPARRDELIGKVKKAFTGVEGVQQVVSSDQFGDLGVADPRIDPHAPDLFIFANEGYAFGDTAAGKLTFHEKPERKGTHGHNANLPDLHATFVAWGRGIKPQTRLGEIQNTDVAPTIARLLNLQIPNPNGKVLTDALTDDPTQSSLNP